MSEGHRVDPEELTRHSNHVVGLGGELTTVGENGGSVDLGIETYGIVGQAFATGSRESIWTVSNAIKALGEGLEFLGEGVRSAGEYYRRTDNASADRLRAIEVDDG